MDLEEVSDGVENEQQFWDGEWLFLDFFWTSLPSLLPAHPKFIRLLTCWLLIWFLCVLELDDIVSRQCDSHELIDNALRDYLGLGSKFKSTTPVRFDVLSRYRTNTLNGLD